MGAYSFFSITGLSITAIGALISVFGALKTRNKDIFRQVCTMVGYNGKDFSALLLQKFYSVIGFIFILLGTIVQILANAIKWKTDIDINPLLLGIIILLIIFILIFIEIGIKRMERAEIGKMKMYYDELFSTIK
jgi:hypothetical protein